MKRWIALGLAAVLLAGCHSAPAPAPAVEHPAPAPVVEPQAPAPVAPAAEPAPAPSAARDDLLAAMVRVPAPQAGDVPDAMKQLLRERSPWAVADNVWAWLYGTQVAEGPFLAPGLEPRVSRILPSKSVLLRWNYYVGDWAEEGRFYFRLGVCGLTTAGQLRTGAVARTIGPITSPTGRRVSPCCGRTIVL